MDVEAAVAAVFALEAGAGVVDLLEAALVVLHGGVLGTLAREALCTVRTVETHARVTPVLLRAVVSDWGQQSIQG